MYATQICILTKNSYKQYICDVCYKDTDASQKTPEMYRSIADLLEKTYLSILSLFLRLSLLFSLSIFLSIHSLFCSRIKISLCFFFKFTCNVCDTNLHSHEKTPLNNILVMYATSILTPHEKNS